MQGFGAVPTCADIGRILLRLGERQCCIRVGAHQDSVA